MADRTSIFLCALVWSLFDSGVHATAPRVAGDRYRLELIVAEPDIVTPTGLAFDSAGRLLVIESHTHQRPDQYDGPASDRIRVLADSDGDGRLDQWSTFAEGFRHAMNLLVRSDGGVYVVTRGTVLLLADTDHDGVADRQDTILRLETDDDYPHNGLGGIAQVADDSLIVGLGENHGMADRLIGSDGTVIAGNGGLDGFFRCSADGANLQHIARGVWNPFSLCVLDDGRIFAVDNDPDASPPCRLLHVVPGGDYGFLYQYGRAGTHPLQSWNGELPGTLPMVCGVGEAPTAIVPHANRLWVTSWGDHRIERYRLAPRGASYGAEREVIVQGDADFRPTGLAVAPDGSLYFGDWVKRDYPVHGLGRIWRLVLPDGEATANFPPRSTEDLAACSETLDPVAAMDSDDPFVHTSGVWRWSQRGDANHLPAHNDRLQLGRLEAERLRGTADAEPLLRSALHDESPAVRLFAVRWVADQRISALRDEVAQLLEGPQPDPEYYLAVLAAVDWLDYEPKMRERDIADSLLVRELRNERRSPSAHALALALLSPDNKYLTVERLQPLLNSGHPQLQLEAVRTLAQRKKPAFDLLAQIAGDENADVTLRAEATSGLAPAARSFEPLLARLAEGESPTLRDEAERVLRLSGCRSGAKENKPPAADLDAWVELLSAPGDAAAGRRLFFSAAGPRCAACHQHSGRGGRIGPDLTHIARSVSRERLTDSILRPSREIAPHYQPWVLTTTDGRTLLGLRLAEGGDDGTEEYADAAGKHFTLPSSDIESREAARISIMPDGLTSSLSIADLRDLVSFLSSTTGAEPIPPSQ